jgi:hypothetical protein
VGQTMSNNITILCMGIQNLLNHVETYALLQALRQTLHPTSFMVVGDSNVTI